MARQAARSRAAAGLLGFALWGAYVLLSTRSSTPRALTMANLAGVDMSFFLFKSAVDLVPGLLAASAAASAYTFCMKQNATKFLVLSLLLGMAAFITPWVIDSTLAPITTTGAPEPPPQVEVAVPQPHSGEERLLGDGSIIRVSDPRQSKPEVVQEGWQIALWENVNKVIEAGQEQCVLIFSRQGCPWCDRLVPVLHNALKTRAASVGSSGGFDTAPLRIFILDAGEFPSVMRQMQIQGFPTILAFGPPGVAPRLAAGYLGDEDFSEMLLDAATADPNEVLEATMEDEEEPEPKAKRQGPFGFFR
eukprot:TRINITY_DN17198_c0_g1_i1.p1 TRINITY_DN17198_c0_g1~~TRINITY_DN17198_c0_g1_i1.p1  ORF type:complete len:305 (-),score=53.97 TRINITY_DN17198_c0_g1_i1:159-1073(-)